MKDTLLFIRNTVTAQTRNEKLDNRDYLVIPCVMIVEGVHNGSQGPLFYSQNELSKFVCCWNMKPALLRHPDSDESGTNIDILKNQGVGILMNTEFDSGKLKTEIWLDVDKANQLDSRIVERIENGEIIEVSTGLFTELDAVAGVWNNEQYVSSALNFRPDHLAILLDATGACSINDGAGMLRNKENKTQNELSHSTIHERLRNLVRDSVPNNDLYVWVMDVYDKYFIYEIEDDKHFRQDYVISSDDEVTLSGDAIEVERKVEYKPVTQNQEVDVKRDEVIASLISNGKFNDGDQPFLNSLTDDQLGQLTANVEKSEETKTENKEEPVVDPQKGSQVVAQNVAVTNVAVTNTGTEESVTVESFLSTAPPEIQAVLNQGLTALNQRRKEAVEKILANENNVFTEEVLNSKPIEEVEAIAKLVGNVKKTDDEEQEKPTQNVEIPDSLPTQTLYAPQPSSTPVVNGEDGEVPVLNTQPLFPKEGDNE
jgi:hypothetical protein